MFTSKNYIEKPIHLVSINSFGKLVLHYEAIIYLKTLKSPLSILSIAGPYRTGKSFLLNSIISNTQNLTHPNAVAPSFQVGHTTNETTHGLWLWSKPLLAYDENNQITNVLVMDSEGYASSQSTHDKRLITLAILLSTCFLFNSKGAIDKDSIFDLEFVIQVARMISQKQEIRTSQENMKGKCDFHWILRDFQLQLVNELGHKITPNEYMQNCLLQAESRVSQRTIETLKRYFPQRTCHTLCHPTTDLQAQQRPEFISQIIGLKQAILKKNMKSFNMTGEAFIELLQSYIDAMNQGEQINSVFQEGYDCRVRLDCLEKLNSKLKRLEQESDDQVDTKLLSIKSEIKQYYKQRMCSNKQITVLDNEVEERINEYQQEFNSSKRFSTSVKCMDKDLSYRNVPIIIPKGVGGQQNHGTHRNVRLSIQCSENEDKSFLGDEELNEIVSNFHHHHSVSSHNNVKASRLVVERKSIEKQKVSPEVKALTGKIEQLQVSLHRTELQLSTAQAQLTHQRQQNEQLRKSLSDKQDELLAMIAKCTTQQKSHLMELQRLEQQKKQKQKQVKLLESQIHKQSLLYEEKIKFLQMELKFGDEERMNEFVVEKNKYKQRIRELSQEIEEMGRKHREETQQVRGIFSQEAEKVKAKSYWQATEESEGKSMFGELEEKVKENQVLHKQVQSLKIQAQKLCQQLQAYKFKSQQRQQSLKQQLQQVTKRALINQQQLKTLYQTKLLTKQSQMSQLQTRIKSLNQIAISENQKLIDSLREMESNFSEEKEDLFVMNNELRNGCLEALQRVAGLKEEIQLKQSRCHELEREKTIIVKRVAELKEEHQREVNRLKEQQKQLKLKLTQKLDQKQHQVHSLECRLLQQSYELQQSKQKSTQLQMQLQMQKQTNEHLAEQLQDLTEKYKQLEQDSNNFQEDFILKQRQVNQLKIDLSYIQDMHKKELSQMSVALQETKQEKTALTEGISQINKQLQAKYESLELMFNEKHEYDSRRYEQTVKEMKQNQKKLQAHLQDSKLQNIKLSERLKFTEKQLESLHAQTKLLKQHLTQTKEQLQQKTFDFQHLQRQSSKQQALSTQKIAFLQQKLNSLTDETQAKSTLHQSREEQLQSAVSSIKVQVQAQSKLYQQTLKTLEATQKQYEHSQKQLLLVEKEASETQSLLMQQVQHLIHRQTTTQKDNSTMEHNLLQLQEHLSHQQVQSENHIRLYNHKLFQVKNLKSAIQNQLTQLNQNHQLLQKQYQQLQANYNSDFALWTKKFARMEHLLKEAGWTQYQLANHRNQDINTHYKNKLFS